MSIYLELAIEHVHTSYGPRVFVVRCAWWTVTAAVAARVRRKNLFFDCSNKRVVAVVCVHTIWTAWPAVASLRIVFCVQRLSLCAKQSRYLLTSSFASWSPVPFQPLCTYIYVRRMCVSVRIRYTSLRFVRLSRSIICYKRRRHNEPQPRRIIFYIYISTDTTVTQ